MKKGKKKVDRPKTDGRASAPKTPEGFPVIMETFRDPTGYWLHSLAQNEPSCFNGDVRIRRYRLTVEYIEEPVEALGARLQALWDACDNSHHWRPLEATAARIGYALQGSAGAKRPRASSARGSKGGKSK